MKYDFDKVVDRSGSGDLKHEVLAERYGRGDLLPLWVADMDFETPQFITDALRKRLEHSLFGYTILPRDYWQTVAKWIEDHHQWRVDEQWMRFIPGIVKGIGFVINVFVKEDEKVIIQPPVYHPFRLTPEGNHRKVVYNPLREIADGSYSMDFENLAEVADEKCRVLILSNPHNPAGITWDADTLRRLADFCSEHNIIVISDEIHSDMAIFGNKHVPFASVSETAAQCSITFGAPSKTFNIPGLVSSWMIVPNPELRKGFYQWMEANEFSSPFFTATLATEVAYTKGAPWLDELLEYIEGNIAAVEDYLQRELPTIRAVRPQASFLIWLDCHGLGLPQPQLEAFFVDKAHLGLNSGTMFGRQGEGFMRLNVAMPRKQLLCAMAQLRDAVNAL